MAKRANGEGTIVKHIVKGEQKGWRASYTMGRDENGKLIRKQLYGKTQKEVKEKLASLIQEVTSGEVAADDKITLGQWYYTWMTEFKKPTVKPKSYDRYESIYRTHIKDSELAHTKLKELRPIHIQQFYNQLAKSKSASAVHTIHMRLKTCLMDAEKHGYIPKNYCKLVTLPKLADDKTVKILTLDEQQRFLKAIEGHYLECFFIVALGTGLRLGELLGLKWSDIDFDQNVLTVNRSIQRIKNHETNTYEVIEQTPKTKNSIRTIPLPKSIVPKLQVHRQDQDKRIQHLGEAYFNHHYVFPNELGYPMNANRGPKTLHSFLKKLEIEQIKFHALRHTYATRLFENNIPPKTVQMLMGHHDISITLDIYTHVMEDKKLEAIERLDEVFIF